MKPLPIGTLVSVLVGSRRLHGRTKGHPFPDEPEVVDVALRTEHGRVVRVARWCPHAGLRIEEDKQP